MYIPIPNKAGIIINKPQLAHGHLAGENEKIRVVGAYAVKLKEVLRKKVICALLLGTMLTQTQQCLAIAQMNHLCWRGVEDCSKWRAIT